MNSISLPRRIFAALLVAGLVAGFTSAARASDEAVAGTFYFNADLGGSVMEDSRITGELDFAGFVRNAKLEFTPGGRLDLGLGYHLTDWFAVELELGLAVNFVSQIEGMDADTLCYTQVPILVNAVCHIPTHSRFRPFIGVGVGGTESQLEDYNLFLGQSDDAFGLAWQGMAGFRYELGRNTELGLAYRYLGTTDRHFGAFPATIGGTQTHSLSLSLSLKF